MEDIKIVIEIPKEKAERLLAQMRLDRNFSECKITPLPKGCDVQRIIPKRVDVQKWVCAECPNCGRELSADYGDGYYIIENKRDFCPNCGQALLWESEE